MQNTDKILHSTFYKTARLLSNVFLKVTDTVFLKAIISLLLLCWCSQAFALENDNFDSDWRFYLGDDPKFSNANYNDQHWRLLNLPHDWSIETLAHKSTDSSGVGPFTKSSVGGTDTGFTMGGTGWYRKHFILPKTTSHKIVTIHFDGVYMESELWINGIYLGSHINGYTPFHYDLTPHLKAIGQDNVIALRVKNIGKNSRWYSGSGIYRQVKLSIQNQIHIISNKVFVTTPVARKDTATIQLKIPIKNNSNAEASIILQSSILNGQVKCSDEIQLAANEVGIFEQNITLATPRLWAPDSPFLYTLVIEINKNNVVIDKTDLMIGIRSLKFNAVKGFVLNENPIELKGGCLHHDNGPLGSAAIDRAEERKIELLKTNGFNAVRTSHNPPSTSFLDACDRLGMLVINEAFDMWSQPKRADDYHRFFNKHWQNDLTSFIERDRNHPSIMMWSIGNEIKERADSSGLAIGRALVDLTHTLDPTRPVTEGICDFWDNPGKTWDHTIPAFALLDVGGYNYERKHYAVDHDTHPSRIIMGTESFAKEAYENWEAVKAHPYVIGDFVWTAMDYIGEAGIGRSIYTSDDKLGDTEWPWYNANCGDLDLCGFKKPQSYYRDVVWDRRLLYMTVQPPSPAGLHELISPWGWPNETPSWTWPGHEGDSMNVKIYSKADDIILNLNGNIFHPTKKKSGITTLFQIPYEPGVLKSFALVNGIIIDSTSLVTTIVANRILLEADRTQIKEANDLVYISVILADHFGNRIFNDDRLVTFSVSGSGYIKAVANANPTEPKVFQTYQCTTYKGQCLLIVSGSTNGIIKIKAQAGELITEIKVKVIQVEKN